ncbi:MAG: TatD family nuclease-associated radical SAM protein [Planctomycetota bacterium]
MDYAYTYSSPRRLYLNVTNRCTNRCSFCVRDVRAGLGDGHLRGGEEPDLDALLAAIDAKGDTFDEIVWCGFGEPTFRLDLIVAAAPELRERCDRVRLDTNGHGALIHGRDVLPDLADAVDEVSVSLNAPTAARYVELCRPAFGNHSPEAFFEATCDFLAGAVGRFDDVTASVVGHALDLDEVEAAEALAESLGGRRFRVR